MNVFSCYLYSRFLKKYQPPSCPNLEKMALIREGHHLPKNTQIPQTKCFMRSVFLLKTPIW